MSDDTKRQIEQARKDLEDKTEELKSKNATSDTWRKGK